MRFFESLKRLLDPRALPPSQSIGQPTADRPPPAVAAPPDVAPADDVTEVRALLDAVAEAPVAAPEPEPLLPRPDLDPEPTPSIDQSTTPPSFEPQVAAVASVAPDAVGNTLILTLATPAATFTVARTSATVGRGPENPIRLDDLSVSRRHARFAYRQGGYWLSDLGSMGGTWVNGTRLNAPRRIASGEVIDIGHCRLTVSFAADPAQVEARKSAGKPRLEVAEQPRRRR
jgi:pSer/pThr/pTyr-binding forkhead associated (FHA) protein